MARKRVIRLPRIVKLKCPFCSGVTSARVSLENSPGSFVCEKCLQEVRAPIMQCCVICAFSKKQCPRTLYMQAKVKGLEIR